MKYGGEFHGWSVFRPLFDYKLRIIDWHKKYTWASVYSWDMEVRRKKGGISINFSDYDAGLFAHHFDSSTYKLKKTPQEDPKNPPQQPFRGGPGASAGIGQKKPGMGQFKYGANRPEACYFFNTSECYNRFCRRPHYCKDCAGPMPHFECVRNGRCAYPRYC